MQGKPRLLQKRREMITLILVKCWKPLIMLWFSLHEIGDCVLNWGINGVGCELMDLAKFAAQGLWRHAVTDFPPCRMVSLAEGRNNNATLEEAAAKLCKL